MLLKSDEHPETYRYSGINSSQKEDCPVHFRNSSYTTQKVRDQGAWNKMMSSFEHFKKYELHVQMYQKHPNQVSWRLIV